MASMVHNPTWTAPSTNKRKPEILFSLTQASKAETPQHTYSQPRAPHRVRVQHPETARGECYRLAWILVYNSLPQIVAPPPLPDVVFWCSPTACPATALDARNPFVQVACSNDPLVSRRRLRAGERYPLARRRRAKRRLARPAPRAPSCGVETCSVWCVQGVGVTWRKSNHNYTRRRGAHTAHTSVSASLGYYPLTKLHFVLSLRYSPPSAPGTRGEESLVRRVDYQVKPYGCTANDRGRE